MRIKLSRMNSINPTRSIRDWPELERPREKLLAQGPQTLSDAELLAIFLRTGIPGRTALDLARDLLAQFGGLRPLLACDQRRFCETRGLGPAKFATLQAVLEMGRRHLAESLPTQPLISGAEDTKIFLTTQLRDLRHEVFACLFLNSRHYVLRFEILFHGTLDGAAVYPREVVSRCIALGASAVILAHNHPSGRIEPSRADRELTTRLGQALALIDVRTLDHIIVGEQGCFSFAEHGLI